MHALGMVQRLLDKYVGAMHAARRLTLAAAVAAVMKGHAITLTRLGRALAGSGRAKPGIKRIDRLIGNPRVASETQWIGAALVAQVCRMTSQLVIAVDWSAVSPGGGFV